jgi:hypothetical protein
MAVRRGRGVRERRRVTLACEPNSSVVAKEVFEHAIPVEPAREDPAAVRDDTRVIGC